MASRAGGAASATATAATATAAGAGSAATASKAISIGYNYVYGVQTNGALRQLANKTGSKVLGDLGGYIENGFSSWIDFSKATLDRVAAAGGKILFDLTNVSDL